MTIRGRAYALPGGQESYHHILQTWWFPMSQNGTPICEGVRRLPSILAHGRRCVEQATAIVKCHRIQKKR